MLPSETTDILKAIAAIDGRFAFTTETAPLAADAWFRTIGDLDFGDALEAAMTYYRTATAADFRIMPGDVRHGVKMLRRARAEALPPAEDLMADVSYDDPHYDGIFQRRRAALLERPAPGTPRALPSR